MKLRDGEWHEVLVDVDDGPDGDHFRYVLSREVTPMQKVLLNVTSHGGRPNDLLRQFCYFS